MNRSDCVHSIAVKDQRGGHLIVRIARRRSGIYYLIPRDAAQFGIVADDAWDLHASYHLDGAHHVKSFGKRLGAPVKRQPLGDAFSGAEPLYAQSFRPGELLSAPLSITLGERGESFEIPLGVLEPAANYALVVD